MTLKEKLYDEYIWTTEPIVEAEEVSESVDKMVKIADEFAIGFAQWCIKKRIDFFDSTEIGETYTIDGNVSKYKMKELLEIYKKEKGL